MTFGEQLRKVESSIETVGVKTEVQSLRDDACARVPSSGQSAEAESTVLSDPSSLPPVDRVGDVDLEQIASVAAISGPSAVVMAWREVEKTLYRLYEAGLNMDLFPPVTRRGSVVEIVDRLRSARLIPDPLPGALDGLRKLRNAAVHETAEISEGEAFVFAELAKVTIEGLQRKNRELSARA